MAELFRKQDWRKTPLGPTEDWPESLCTLVGVMLSSSQPMFIVWGPERTTLYNDAYAEILADKHPALALPFEKVWEEIWEADLEPIVSRAYAGEALHMEDIPLTMLRKGYPEETHFAFSYTPVRVSNGKVSGFFCPCLETTGQVLEERRGRLRASMTEALQATNDPVEIKYAAASLIGRHLGIQQVAYADTSADGGWLLIETEWNDGTLENSLGTHELSDLDPDILAELQAGRSVAFSDIAKSDCRLFEGYRARGVRAVVCVPSLVNGKLSTILSLHSSSTRIWHPGDVAMVEEMIARTSEALERRRLEQAHRLDEKRLRETRESLELATQASKLGAGTWDFTTGKITLDELGRAIVGLLDGEDRIDDWFDRTHPADREALDREVRQCIAERRPFDLHYRVVHEDGQERHIHGIGLFDPDEQGEPLFGTGFVRDITNLKQTEQRQNLLMAELDHRVKNILALVQSVTQMSLKPRQGDDGSMAEDLVGRIKALAQSHSLLADNRWSGAQFSDLIETAVAPYLSRGSERIHLNGPDFRISAKSAQTLGLAFHELLTNAAKYGALSRDGGTVRASWEISGNEAGKKLSFSWVEQGGPSVVLRPKHKGFGTILIEGALAYELGGQLSLDFRPSGLIATFDIPLERIIVTEPGEPTPVRREAATSFEDDNRIGGKTIMTVEDEHLVARQVERTLRDVGCTVLGPVGTVKDALTIAVSETVDAAILDINLHGEFIWPVARALHARRVPILFATGYSDLLETPEDLAAVPRVIKPFQPEQLLAAIAGLFPDRGSRTPD